ncbi:MAG: hypothetical protein AB1714_19820 [Acidobacteriota bacterium]
MLSLDVNIRREDVLHFLGYPRERPPAPRMQSLLDAAIAEAQRLVRPAGVFRELRVAASSEIGLRAEKAEGLLIGLVTIGPGIEDRVTRLLRDGNMTRALIVDACGSAAAETAADCLGALIVGETVGDAAQVSCRVSPGYGRWPLSAQRALFDLLPHRELGVSLRQSMMMIPRKSISFAMWLGASARPLAGLSGCARCGLAHCRYRRSGPESHHTKESRS